MGDSGRDGLEMGAKIFALNESIVRRRNVYYFNTKNELLEIKYVIWRF